MIHSKWFLIAAFALASFNPCLCVAQTWQCDGPFEASVTAIAISPANPKQVIAWTLGLVGPTLYISTDAGQTWSAIRNAQHGGNITGIVFGKKNPTSARNAADTIYISANGGGCFDRTTTEQLGPGYTGV